MTYEATYRSGKGPHHDKYRMMWDKYIPSYGDKIRTGNKKATEALQKLRVRSRRYYRYFNDGDGGFSIAGYYIASPANKSRHAPRDEKAERLLDEQMERTILAAWNATEGATLPSYTVEDTPYEY